MTVGNIQVPHVRWGGRWHRSLTDADVCDDNGAWVELADYGVTTGYQVARALNLSSAIPVPPPGKKFEFGARIEENGSILLVRCVDDPEAEVVEVEVPVAVDLSGSSDE